MLLCRVKFFMMTIERCHVAGVRLRGLHGADEEEEEEKTEEEQRKRTRRDDEGVWMADEYCNHGQRRADKGRLVGVCDAYSIVVKAKAEH